MAKLLIEMGDNSEWEVPLGIVVSHRNKAYVIMEKAPFTPTTNDLISWVRGHMDWTKDLAPHATCTKPPSPPDYDALILDAELVIQ
jgi:hypothetical protein